LSIMQATSNARWAVLATLGLGLALAGCSVDVSNTRSGKDVDVRTPVGTMSVSSQADPRDTGLPVYPGATPVPDRDNHDNGNVDIATSWFGVRVVAVSFETDDPPERVLAFYRDRMGRTFGRVMECRGDIDFKGARSRRQPVCTEHAASAVELLTGTEARQHLVAVKHRPTDSGSAFSLVFLETQGGDR
jgi:hypothetical protein